LSGRKKINLLVIPDLFPRHKGDVQGIFVLDYLACVEPYCQINVLSVKVRGQEKGLQVEQRGGYTLHRYCLSDKRTPAYLKPFYYFKWFVKGYQLGRTMQKPDIIHSHGTILSGTLSYLLARRFKVPFLITEHQGPFSMISGSSWKRNWARRIMERADTVLTVSEHLKQEILQAGIKPGDINVSFNPVNTQLFQLRRAKVENKMLFVGRLDAFKGALRCVKAFERVSERYPEATLTIIGDGEEYVPIRNFIGQRSKLASKVQLLGLLSKEEIAVEMQKASFLVFPSKHESFGLVVAEALSCGLPVITTNRTAPREFVNKKNGLLVDPESIDEIADAMISMLKDFSLYNPFTIRQEIIERFGFENFGKRLANQYEKLIL
jgi:L-malate glycosyltransferase